MPLQSDGPAPYAPPATVLDVIRRYRNHGLGTPFTLDVLVRAGVTDSLAPRTLQALKLLELTDDDGMPTEVLIALGKAGESEYQERFAAFVRGVYADVFSYVDPAQEPEGVRDAFRSFTPRGQQERMVTLFMGLAAHAGIVSPETPAKAAGGTARNGAGQRRAAAPRRERTPQRKPAGGRGVAMPQGLPPALAGLIEELVSIGPSWNDEQRERFLSAFQTMVDYSFPVQPMVARTEDAEEAAAEEMG